MSNITNWQNSRNESFLIVRVEKDSANFHMSSIGNLHYDHSFEGGNLNMYQMNIINLLDTELSIILDLDNATEEQAMQVVDVEYAYCRCGNTVYKDYTPSECPFISAKMSFRSLACFLNLDTENYNHVFLKIEQ